MPTTQMTLYEAKAIVGNQSTHSLRNMVRTLGLLAWLNTPTDKRRLEAAKVVIRSRRGARNAD